MRRLTDKPKKRKRCSEREREREREVAREREAHLRIRFPRKIYQAAVCPPRRRPDRFYFLCVCACVRACACVYVCRKGRESVV